MGHEAFSILSPVVQFGFAGMAVIQFACIIWMIKRFLSIVESTNLVISRNTEAINTNVSLQREIIALQRKECDLLLQRPCIIDWGPSGPPPQQKKG